jgi:hypothetical protein
MTLVDSGVAYCTAHNGIIDCDEDRCDFRDCTNPEWWCAVCDGSGTVGDHGSYVDCVACDGDGCSPCTPTPLLYEEVKP